MKLEVGQIYKAVPCDCHPRGGKCLDPVLVPVEPERNEVWLSDPFGAYLVIDIANLAVDTVTDVRRKVYLGAEIGGDDDE
jgi:hypothetical protein